MHTHVLLMGLLLKNFSLTVIADGNKLWTALHNYPLSPNCLDSICTGNLQYWDSGSWDSKQEDATCLKTFADHFSLSFSPDDDSTSFTWDPAYMYSGSYGKGDKKCVFLDNDGKFSGDDCTQTFQAACEETPEPSGNERKCADKQCRH